MRRISGLTASTLALAVYTLTAGMAVAGDARGKVRYVGDGTVILGDGTRYKLPEGSNLPEPKEGQHVTIEFKKGHNRNEVTRMRVDD